MNEKFRAHQELLPYIESYSIVKTEKPEPVTYWKMPRGNTDILIILGEDFQTDKPELILRNEHIYLTGIKTSAVRLCRQAYTHIIRISFKAGALNYFYKLDPLAITPNLIVEQNNLSLPNFDLLRKDDIKEILDLFFLKRLNGKHELYMTIIHEIEKRKGQINVEQLLKKFPITERQLERLFKEKVGLNPKSFIRLIRFQSAYESIINNRNEKSLLEIAFDCGYYDHSHLCNEIKRYTGFTPTQL